MRTFYIATAIFLLFIAWLLHKPIPRAPQVAREFTDSEIEYLEKTFDYAMETLKAGEHMDWSVAAVNGRISAGKEYVSTQKASCRNYIEIARTYDAQKVESGIACKRVGKDGWCRLNPDNAQSCALEVAESSLAKRGRFAILQGSQMIDQLMGKRIDVDGSRLVPHAPSVGLPAVNAPHMQKPDIEPGDFRPPLPWDPEK